MNTRAGAALALLLALAHGASAADIANGETLHAKHCTSCHQSDAYWPPERSIQCFERLHRQVQACEVALNLRLLDSDIDDLTAYLDHHFYRFGNPD